MKGCFPIPATTARAVGLAIAMAFASTCAVADQYLVSESGTFDPSTPTTAESAPGASFSFSFSVDSNPAVTNVSPDYFNTDFADFTYTLNGSPLPVTPVVLTWYDDPDGGGIEFSFSSGDGFNIYGDPYYSGLTSSPTILVGGYPLFSDSDFFYSTTQATPLTGELDITPEPPSVLLLVTGLAVIGVAVRQKFHGTFQ